MHFLMLNGALHMNVATVCGFNTVNFRLLVPLWKKGIQTDQSNASYTETSSSMTNLIGQFGF